MRLAVSLDWASVQRALETFPRAAQRAERHAVQTTTTFARQEIWRRLQARYELPTQKGFRPKRIKRYDARGQGKVWVGLQEVKSRYLANKSEIRQDAGGAWARRHFFPGGFVVTFRSGHKGIFRRTGRLTSEGKRQIEEQTLPVDFGFQAVQEVALLAEAEMGARFAAKFRELSQGVT